MNIAETKRILHVCLNADVVPVIWGYDGVGKTEITHEVTGEWLNEDVIEGENYVTINLANHSDAGDLIGIPVEKIMSELERTVFALPDLWPEPNTESRGVIFLDEFNRASIAIMQAMYPFILQRRLHKYRLPKGWRIILACNPDGSEYSVNPMDVALMTRFAHIMFEPEMAEWLAWAKRSGVNNFVHWFVETSGPEILYGTLKDKKVGSLIKVDQRPRTHKLLSTLLKTAEDMKQDDSPMIELLARAVYGDQIGVSFARFVDEKSDKPLPGEQIIDNYKKVQKTVLEWANQVLIKTAVLKKTAENASEVLRTRFIDRGHQIVKDEIENYVSFLLDVPKEIAIACLRHDIHEALHEYAQKFPEEERKKVEYVQIQLVQELSLHPRMQPITSLAETIASMKDHEDHEKNQTTAVTAPAQAVAETVGKPGLFSRLTGK